MRAETTEIREAIAANPDQAPGIVLRDIPWDFYLRLRELDANRHTRMTYHDGTLILMSPPVHP